VLVVRTVYWSAAQGTVAPVDEWLGIAVRRYSPGVRELSCREASSGSFRQAADDLRRVGQIVLTHETLRRIVEAEGRQAVQAQQSGRLRPSWSAGDCRVASTSATCVITGADGVKVPLVTELEKAKRRRLRRGGGPQGRRRRCRMRRGSDQAYKEAYKEFKLVAFYDQSKDRQYAVGTRGNHEALGRLMRRVAGWIDLGTADVSYSVTDGADWIRKQYNQRLAMLAANVLDYYHLREHVIAASYEVFGQNTPEASVWREQMMGVVLEQGPLALLDRVGQLRKSLRGKNKRQALAKLRQYVAKRVEMLDYPAFIEKGYEIGSGPTEAFCKTFTPKASWRWPRSDPAGCGTATGQINAETPHSRQER